MQYPARSLGVCCAAPVLLFALAACGGGGGGGGPAPTPSQIFGLLSPPSPMATASSDRMSIQIRADDRTRVSITNNSAGGATLEGLRGADSFWVHGLPLVAGDNDILVTAERGGDMQSLPLLITAPTVTAPTFVRANVGPQIAETVPAEAAFDVLSNIADASQVLLDADGNGTIDATVAAGEPLRFAYTNQGNFAPRVFVRNSDDVLVASEGGDVPPVRIVSPSLVDPALQIATGAPIRDLSFDASRGRLFALVDGQPLVKVYDIGRNLIADVTITGGVDLIGVAAANDGSFYACDFGRNRNDGSMVYHYIESSPGNFIADQRISDTGGFGISGTIPGRLRSATDVAVSGAGDDLRLWVSDFRNVRVQTFGRAGAFYQLTTGENDGFSAIIEPASNTGLPGGGVAVLEQGGSTLRLFARDGRTLSQITGLNAANQVEFDAASQSIVVAETGAGAVRMFALDGREARTVRQLPNPPRAVAVGKAGAASLLFIASAGVSAIDVAVLSGDAPDADPASIVRRFGNAVRDGDFTTARSLVSTDRRADFDALIASGAEAGRVRAEAGTLRDLDFVETRGDAAVVIGQREAGGVSTPAEFVLHRDALAGGWRLTDF